MDLTKEKTIKSLFRKRNFRPLKKLGQNFLIDKNILDKIILASRLTNKDIVLEIGPGIGTLTQALALKAKKVIAIEKDKKLALILKQTLLKYQNVEIIWDDILKASFINDKLPMINNCKVVANLPYNIALAVIRKFIEEKNPPETMILMLQKEVAEKICSQKSSLPKIAIEFYAKPKILFYVPKDCFWPQPKVDGAVIKITDIQKNVPKVNKDLFFKILKAGFASPRKTILNNLSKSLKLDKEKTTQWLKNSSISPQKRPENLTLKDWLNLANSFNF